MFEERFLDGVNYCFDVCSGDSACDVENYGGLVFKIVVKFYGCFIVVVVGVGRKVFTCVEVGFVARER